MPDEKCSGKVKAKEEGSKKQVMALLVDVVLWGQSKKWKHPKIVKVAHETTCSFLCTVDSTDM